MGINDAYFNQSPDDLNELNALHYEQLEEEDRKAKKAKQLADIEEAAKRLYPECDEWSIRKKPFPGFEKNRAIFTQGANFLLPKLEAEKLAHEKTKLQLEKVLGLTEPFALVDVLERLSQAADYLLTVKSYDGHDYEEIGICSNRAKDIIKLLKPTK